MTFAVFEKSRERKRRLDQIEATLDETQSKIAAQQPRVNQLVAWLNQRKLSNGFGEDFEWTLAHPRGRQG